MARQAYNEDQSIHSMTTRQLRQYIADKAAEAEQRLNTVDLDDASRAFRQAADEILDERGKVMKSTSYMSKEEMRERAYALRDFNSLDTTSGYSKSIDWQENRQRYKSFIKARADDPYWNKYITPKGNVSKKGYEDYKQYVNFIKSVKDVKSEFGYMILKKYGVQTLQDPEQSKRLEKIIHTVYEKNKGVTQAQLIDKLMIAIQADEAKRQGEQEFERLKQEALAQARTKVKTGAKSANKTAKKKSKKSSTNIKTKQGRKMREHGSVRRTGK